MYTKSSASFGAFSFFSGGVLLLAIIFAEISTISHAMIFAMLLCNTVTTAITFNNRGMKNKTLKEKDKAISIVTIFSSPFNTVSANFRLELIEPSAREKYLFIGLLSSEKSGRGGGE